MSASSEPLMFYVGKSFFDRAKKTFNMGFIVRKPLLQFSKAWAFSQMRWIEMRLREPLRSSLEQAA